jgi:(2Fe-2S) ferredoxin
MQTHPVPFEKQIFVCTNDRHGEKPSCGDHQAEAIFTELRRIAKDRGLHPRIRVAQAKCLGKCNEGTTIMVYPDNAWHSQVSLQDVPILAEKYLSLPKSS